MPIEQELARALNQPIQTQRLLLEPLLSAHADLLFVPLCDERIYRWIDSDGPSDLIQLRIIWKHNEGRLSPDGEEAWLNWAIRLANNGPYIGTLDAELDSPVRASNIGFVFFPEYWGQGYATETLLAVKTMLMANGVTVMKASASVHNIASARVLEHAGFSRDGTSPDATGMCQFGLVVSRESVSAGI